MSTFDFETELFGERLLQLIKANNLTQATFAEVLCVSPSFINNLIKGKKKPGTEFLKRIKRNFEVNIDWLLFGPEEPENDECFNIELLKAIALRIDIVKAAVSGNAEAVSILEAMHPNIKPLLNTCSKSKLHVQWISNIKRY